MPTPMIEPIRVCELDAGRPRYHGEAGGAADLQDELDRQHRDDAEGDGAAREHDAEEIKEPRPYDRDMGGHRMGVDHGRDRVRRVVEAVDELEA